MDNFTKLKSAIKDKTAIVGVIGLGYVGLPLLLNISTVGYRTVGYDVNHQTIKMLQQSKSTINAISNEKLQKINLSYKIIWSYKQNDLKICDIIIICVPSPLTPEKTPDLSFLNKAASTIKEVFNKTSLVIIETTVYPGTTDNLIKKVFNKIKIKEYQKLYLSYSPERIDPLNSLSSITDIPKIISGVGKEDLEIASDFYSNIFKKLVPVSDIKTAEAVKIIENVFRTVNIGLVNELKIVYSSLGIDIWEAIKAATSKPFGFMPFYPGPGVGGHCIPIDPVYLSWKAQKHGLKVDLINSAQKINESIPEYIVKNIQKKLSGNKSLHGKNILIIGLAYKANIPDIRESPSIKIIELLSQLAATVHYYDPLVKQPNNEFISSHISQIDEINLNKKMTDYDAIVIATDHNSIDYKKIASYYKGPIFDTRNAMRRRGLKVKNLIIV